MSESVPSWARGLAILADRQTRLPDALRDAWNAPLDLDDAATAISRSRSVVTTGVGSSLAHARYLSWLLRTRSSSPSWDVPTGSFLSPAGPEAKDQTLILFSQGLSPNARVPLVYASHYRACILITAASADSPDRANAVRAAKDQGVQVVAMPCAPEYEVLLRFVGPMIGYVVALRLAIAAGANVAANAETGETLAKATRDAATRMNATLADADPHVFSDPITLVATHGYAALSHNLCAKVLEGMYIPWPAALDALELAHGVLQEASGKPRTFVALGRSAPHEEALFARARQTLEPQHRWLAVQATLPEPLTVFEHESMMNALVLAAIGSRRLDQREWPGKGRDGPLYSLASAAALDAPSPAIAASSGAMATSTRSRRIDDLTWPEVEAALKSGMRTIVLPLGATEQHGPHLPLSVDTLIGDALAERFCARVPEALRARAVAVGCSVEHLAFAGTLSYSEATLTAMVGDLVDSFVRHGFDHVVVFSSHGGNDSLLAAAVRQLKARARPAKVTIVHGVENIGKIWQAASERAGVPRFAAGHHAGEYETSILAALRPEIIRWAEVRNGTSADVADGQSLFYPSLRNHAPEGVVGDPSHASAANAEAYLAAWLDVIVDAYEADRAIEVSDSRDGLV